MSQSEFQFRTQKSVKCHAKHLTVLQSLFQIIFQYDIDPNVTVRAKIGMDQSEYELKKKTKIGEMSRQALDCITISFSDHFSV